MCVADQTYQAAGVYGPADTSPNQVGKLQLEQQGFRRQEVTNFTALLLLCYCSVTGHLLMSSCERRSRKWEVQPLQPDQSSPTATASR